jgi:hypothetical protein
MTVVTTATVIEIETQLPKATILLGNRAKARIPISLVPSIDPQLNTAPLQTFGRFESRLQQLYLKAIRPIPPYFPHRRFSCLRPALFV